MCHNPQVESTPLVSLCSPDTPYLGADRRFQSRWDTAAAAWLCLLSFTPISVSCQNFHSPWLSIPPPVWAKLWRARYWNLLRKSLAFIHKSYISLSCLNHYYCHSPWASEWHSTVAGYLSILHCFIRTNLGELAGQHNGHSTQNWANP